MDGRTDRPDKQEKRDHVAYGTKTSLPILSQKPSYHADVSEPERDQTNNTDLFTKVVTSTYQEWGGGEN